MAFVNSLKNPARARSVHDAMIARSVMVIIGRMPGFPATGTTRSETLLPQELLLWRSDNRAKASTLYMPKIAQRKSPAGDVRRTQPARARALGQFPPQRGISAMLALSAL